jgi:hypothetical protein
VGTSAGVCTAGCSIGSAATGLCNGDDKGGATKVLAAVCEADSAGPFPGGGILTDATTVGRDAFQIAVILLGWVMQQQDKAEHYRKEANRCADLAQTAQLDFLSEIARPP